LTRRTLLGATGAAAFAQTVTLPRNIRVGFIGVAQGAHSGDIIAPLDRLPGVEIVAIAEKDAGLIKRFKGNKPRLAAAKPYTDARRMLDAEKLDVVAICNTQGERAGAVIECAQRKLNVIAEKPLAITLDEMQRVKKAVNESGIKLGTLLTMRTSPPYKALKEIVSSGAIGEVIQISSQKSYKLGSRPDWFKKSESYGSTILWIGIHMIDLMRWISGREFTHAASFMGRVGFPDLGDMETTTSTSFRLDNGGTAALHMDYCMPETAPAHGDDRLRLSGTKGIGEYMAATGVTLVTSTAKPTTIEKLPPKGSLFIEYLEYAYNGKPPSLSHEEIFAACDATLAAHEAAVKGSVVRLTK
jgi:predicted dehydrogenase